MEKLLNKIKKIIPKKLFENLQPAYHLILSWLAALWYGFPSDKLIIIGVTGTTGKTTCVYLIAKMLEVAGYKTGFTSTAMFNDGKSEWLNDKKMTMTGRFFTQKIIKKMVKNKCQYCIIETTSQGIEQFRHRFINYDILVFTGLYPEHIEAHGSFEKYKEAKGKLFQHLKKCKTKYADENKIIHHAISGFKKIGFNRIKKIIIANGDDECADYFLDFWAEEKMSYKVKSKKLKVKSNDAIIQEIIAENIQTIENGTSFVAEDKEIYLSLLGEFNVSNAMTGVAVGLSQGIDIKKIKAGLESVKNLPGRLEKINEGQNFTVIVDYAFEPNAVAKLYEVTSLMPHQKIIHVLGSAGGGRDISRRPVLGKLAGENADYVIITNEDPYNDDPYVIIEQVAIGAEKLGKVLNKNLFKILDRRVAIAKALNLADIGDIVLITGKGCEQAICMADGKKISWDDRKVTEEELKKIINKNNN